MSYRGRRRDGWRLPYEEIRNLRAASRSIRLSPEFTHITLGRRRVLTLIAAGLISIAAIGAFKLHKAYANYASIVDERLDQRTSRHRAGVYAAPRRVSVGQQISQDELRDRLLRAGYRQGRRDDPPGQLSSGVFIIEGDAMRLRSNSFDRAANEPETVKIKFNRRNGAQIVKIEDAATGADLE